MMGTRQRTRDATQRPQVQKMEVYLGEPGRVEPHAPDVPGACGEAWGAGSAAQVLVEELDRPLPRELGCGLVVSRRRVVVEPVHACPDTDASDS